ncbi:MAG: MlaD family protein [Gammaproteobacteria bacterium]|nr:MlaD family protein [Gammaproteobacteria bacterium]
MNSKSYALRAGLFVLILGATMVAAVLWVAGRRPAVRPYIVVTNGSVFGLKVASTIFFRGIEAGTVRRIRIDPHDPRKIFIIVAIDDRIPVTHGTYAELKLQGVTGLTALELESTGDLRPLPTSRAHPARIPMRPSLLDALGRASRATLTELTRLGGKLDRLLSADNERHIRVLLTNAANASRQFQAISDNLATASRALPALAQQGQQTLRQLDAVSRRLDRLSGRLNTLVTTAQTAGNTVLAQTLPRINATLDQLRATAADVNALSRSLRHNPQQLLLGAPPQMPGPGEPGYRRR